MGISENMTFWLLCDFEAELLHAVNRKLESVSKAYALSDTKKMVR